MVHLFLRKKDGTFAARQDVRLKWPGPDHSGPFGGFGRAVTNPHLLDWNRDGQTDLVVGYTQGGWHDTQWTLYVGTGPLAGKTEVAVKPQPITNHENTKEREHEKFGIKNQLASSSPFRPFVLLCFRDCFFWSCNFSACCGEVQR
jgi:hypothetical protein